MKPEIVRSGALDMQVCVPKDWNDKAVIAFAEEGYPCGTEHGWVIRKAGAGLLDNDPSRNPCLTNEGYVHITLDA